MIGWSWNTTRKRCLSLDFLAKNKKTRPTSDPKACACLRWVADGQRWVVTTDIVFCNWQTHWQTDNRQTDGRKACSRRRQIGHCIVISPSSSPCKTHKQHTVTVRLTNAVALKTGRLHVKYGAMHPNYGIGSMHANRLNFLRCIDWRSCSNIAACMKKTRKLGLNQTMQFEVSSALTKTVNKQNKAWPGYRESP